MKFFIWTDFDLDGTGSLLLLKWIFPELKAKISFKSTKIASFREEFLNWKKTDSIENYDKVFFIDLDVSSMIDLVDNPKSVIIDHHSSHASNKNNYKKASLFIEEYTSCILLLYKIFKNKVNITEQQKRLILLIDDYDSYKHRFIESLELNFLFSDLQKGDYSSKVERFLAVFNEGFKGFDDMQRNIILFYKNKVDRTIKNCEFFYGKIPIGNKSFNIISTVVDTAINEVCDYILKYQWKEPVDVAITFNPKTNSVSFRTKNENIDVSKLATYLCEGGGHRYAAGGKINEKFIEFTKLLQRI